MLSAWWIPLIFVVGFGVGARVTVWLIVKKADRIVGHIYIRPSAGSWESKRSEWDHAS